MIALSAILGATCERSGDDSTAKTPTPIAGVPTQSPTASPASTPTPLPTATPTPAPLSGAEIFSRVSPNVPVIMTGSGLGSGVLIPGGFIVTNAHVVWGYPNVLVKFPNSDAHRTLPVIGLDLMADLAVIGPVNVLEEGLELKDGEDLAIGSDVYLVGYPDEVEVFPDKPTITRGVISRFRQWRALDLTLIQSDAATGGGQSGGVMVSENGDVIGITTRTFGDRRFIIATSAADIRERVDGLIQGEDVDGLRDRPLPSHGATQHQFKLTDQWDSKIAVLYEREDTEIEIRLESETDSAFAVADVSGDVILDVDDSESGVEWGSTTLETLGPHFVLFQQFSSEAGEFALQASHDLHFVDDKDDHRRVSVNESVIGNVDAPLDEDYFELQLDAGESVAIRVESFMMNPYVRVARADWTTAAVSDDDGGGGVLGRDAFVSFTAQESGTYIVLVSDSWDNQVGGYFLKVDGAPRQAVSPTPAATPVPRPVPSPHGLMSTYANAEYEFSIQYPTDWLESPRKSAWEGVESQFRSDDDEFLTVRIHDLPKQGLGGWSLDDYVDFWAAWIESEEIGGHVTANIEYGDIGGKPARLLAYTHSGTQSVLLIFVNDQKISYSAGYDLRLPPAEDTLRMVKYSLGTFTVRGQPLRFMPQLPPIETYSPDSPATTPESAPEPIWFAPMATYRDEENSLSIQFPADWTAYGSEQTDVVTFESDYREFFSVFTDNSRRTGPVYRTLDEYVDWLVQQLESTAGYEIVQISDYGEIKGLPARLLLHTNDELERHLVNLVFLSEQQVGYAVSYDFPASFTGELAPLIEYSFRSITAEGSPLTNTPDFPDLQRVFSGAAAPSTESAPVRGRFMPIATYDHDEYSFSIQYPAEWIAEEGDDPEVEIASAEGDTLELYVADPRQAGLGDQTLDQHVDEFLHTIESSDAPEDLKPRVVSSSRFGQIAGRPAHLLILDNRQTDEIAVYFLYIDEDGVLFQVLVILHTAQREDLQQIVDYSLRSITIDGNPLTNTPEFPSLATISSSGTVQSTEPSPGQSRLVPMAMYSSDEYTITIQHPADWKTNFDSDTGAQFQSRRDDILTLFFADRDHARGNRTLDQLVDDHLSALGPEGSGFQVVSSSRFGEVGGLPAHLTVLFDHEAERLHVYLFHVDDGGVIYMAIFSLDASNLEDLQPIVEYSLRSLTIDGNPLTEAPEFPSLAPSSSDDTQPAPDSSLTQSPFGPMATYRDDEFAFSFQYPADWEVLPEDGDWKARFLGGEGAALGIGFQDFGDETPVSLTPEQHHQLVADVIIEHWRPAGSGHRILSNSDFGVIDDRPVHLTLVTTLDGRENLAVLTFLSATDVFYVVALQIPASGLDRLVPMFDYLIRSITIDGKPLTGAPEFPSFETVSSNDAQPSPESSLIQSPFGPMSTYRDDEFGFAMQYPTGWEEQTSSVSFDARFVSDARDTLGVSIEDHSGLGFSTPERYIDQILLKSDAVNNEYRVLYNSDFGHVDGRLARLLVFASNSDDIRLVQLVYVSADSAVYKVWLGSRTFRFEGLAPLFYYLLRSITIYGAPLTDTPEFPSTDTAPSDETQQTPESSQVQSPFGPMSTYRDDKFAFSIHHPAGWIPLPVEGEEGRVHLTSGDQGVSSTFLSVAIISLPENVPREEALDAYLETHLASEWARREGTSVLFGSRYGQIDGRPAHLIIWRLVRNNSVAYAAQLLYVSDDLILYGVNLSSSPSGFRKSTPLFEHLLNSVMIDGKPLVNTPEFPRVE
ncbi:MAG: serine protease [Chloroflexi bacterium]|nr:serine protease [Chloroflexota bacterium]